MKATSGGHPTHIDSPQTTELFTIAYATDYIVLQIINDTSFRCTLIWSVTYSLDEATGFPTMFFEDNNNCSCQDNTSATGCWIHQIVILCCRVPINCSLISIK